MYGAGNIGRGFIGQLMSQSGYQVAFVDVNMQVIDALNARGEYPVEILENDGGSEVIVKNVSGVNGMDVDAVASAIADADVMATAVGVNILPRIVGNIAKGLQARWARGNKAPFNIIICENLIGADTFLRNAIKEQLSAEEQRLVDETIGFVEASIGRMVPIQTPEMTKGDVLRVCVEKFCTLIVDRDAFRGDIPPIQNMEAHAPFQLYIERKLYIHNMGHSMTAYLGALKGYEYIWQAIEDPEIERIVVRGMVASALALSMKYNVPFKALYEHVEDLLYRFTNRKLGDTVFRVGRDLKRKLSPDDRLLGAIRTCNEVGVSPVYLYVAVAAAMRFAGDEVSAQPPEKILTEISGLKPGSNDYLTIMEFSKLLEKENGLQQVYARAKRMMSV